MTVRLVLCAVLMATALPQSGVISGLVVDEAGRPVSAVAMRLVGARSLNTVLSDSRGRFSYSNIGPGEYVLVASKHGFFDGAFGKRHAGGDPLPFSLFGAQSIADMRVELFRAGVVTGRVLDEGYEPVSGARVIAMRRDFVEGGWRYVESGFDTTDDLGTYRVYGLKPGEYLITTPTLQATTPAGESAVTSAHVNLNPGEAYPTLFFPATQSLLLATAVRLGSGEVKYAVDFHWSPVPAQRIAGRLLGDQKDIAGQLVRLIPSSLPTDFGNEAALTLTNTDGTFAMLRVPAGEYRLEAGRSDGSWGRASVIVEDEDLAGLLVSMRGRVSVSGFVSVGSASGSGSANLATMSITIVPARQGLSPTARAVVDKNGRFSVKDLIPGEYFVRVSALPVGFHLEWIEAGGLDLVDRPIDLEEATNTVVDVTLTDRPTEILGTVRDSRMLAASGAAIIVLPAGSTRWSPHRTRRTRASTSGVFAVTGLPAGEYLIVAVDEAATEGWQDATVLAQLAALATRVKLGTSERRSLDMQLSAFKAR